MKKRSPLKRQLSLRTETVKSLRSDDLGRAAGAAWTVTLGLSCFNICPTMECTLWPTCMACTGGGGGGTLSGVHCPK
jgi:hypothetical protein